MPTTLAPVAVERACPWHPAAASAPGGQAVGVEPGSEPGLQAHDVLVLPMPKRLVLQYATADDGSTELRLYHERQEISFDDPAQFGFGEALARQTRFTAGDATTWGAGYRWPEVRELLQQLLDAGVLQLAPEAEAEPLPRTLDDGARPSPLPPAQSAQPRDWRDTAPVMAALTGRALDPAHLECVVPVFRVAHPALDADGRQVGEANVFPPALRLDVPTRWRTCIYAGTRHRSEQPMNVSALKSMRAHWPAMMALLRTMRAAYLRRYPEAAGGWTVGHLERLSTAVLAWPTYLLMRAQPPRAAGALHPALSSLFRVTDGLRMTMHQMMFVPIGERARHPDEPMTAAQVHAYAERNYSFHSEHGVCAGPQAMVDEFLNTVIDGHEPRDGVASLGEPELQQALQAVEPALDYGLRGLQVYAVIFSLWPEMARRYEALAAVAAGWAASGSAAGQRLHERFGAHLETLQESSFLATEDWRSHRDAAYADMLVQCARGLGQTLPDGALRRLLEPASDAGEPATVRILRQAWRQWARQAASAELQAADEPFIAALQALVLEHLQRLRALLAAAETTQQALNAGLGRAAPLRPLAAADLDLHNQLQGAARRRLPYLLDELSHLLQLELTVTAESLDVTPRIDPHGAG